MEVSNNMKLIRKDKISGEVVTSFNATIKLGGPGNPKFRKVFLDLDSSFSKGISLALLDIGLTSRNPPQHIKWRLWFDGFPLAREFKPFTINYIEGEGYFYKVLFDITPVMKLGKTQHIVSIYYEGSESLIVNHVNIMAALIADGAENSYSYLSGGLILAPNTSCTLKIPLEALNDGVGEIKTTIDMPSTLAKVHIRVNGHNILTLNGIIGCDEIIIPNLDLKCDNAVEIIHEAREQQYYPKHVKVSNILLASSKMLRPKIIISSVTHDKENNKLIIKLKNIGQVEPDKIILLALSKGIPIARSIIEPIKPEEEKETEVPLGRLPKTEKELTLRIVWTRLSRTIYEDKKVNLFNL